MRQSQRIQTENPTFTLQLVKLQGHDPLSQHGILNLNLMGGLSSDAAGRRRKGLVHVFNEFQVKP